MLLVALIARRRHAAQLHETAGGKKIGRCRPMTTHSFRALPVVHVIE
jgi:hypothetical protein